MKSYWHKKILQNFKVLLNSEKMGKSNTEWKSNGEWEIKARSISAKVRYTLCRC